MTGGPHCWVEISGFKLLAKRRAFEAVINEISFTGNFSIEDLADLLIVFGVPQIIVVIQQLRVISVLVYLVQVRLGAVHS